MSNQNFRQMIVATLPLDEPMRANRPHRTMAQVFERPDWKNKGRRQEARDLKHKGEES